ncbi:MAG TPA: DinB family protein [Terriglobales bacterium]|nr:DinB family protein [Terriglobales bacterium]
MKRLPFLLVLVASISLLAQEKKEQKPAPTLKSVLLEQLRSTHNKAEWFVPANTAVEGLTAEQASWTDGKGNHSVGQLAYHLVFWDREQLAKFKGEPPPKYSGDNNETFNNFDNSKWNEIVKQLDEVMTEWEKAVESADEAKLKEWSSGIAHVGTHNAYHIGQIVIVRKEQGSWNPEKGVK